MTPLLRRWAVITCSLLASLIAPSAWSKDCAPPFTLPTEAALTAVAQQAQDRGFLWKISKQDSTSYLYGTMHLGRLDWWAPGPRVTAALESSRVLALEMDLSDNATATKLTQGMRAKENDPRLPSELAARLRQQAEAECLDWQPLQNLRPEFQLSTVLVMSARRQQLEAAYGAETMLTALARRQGKPIHALETVDEQLHALQASDAAELKEMIESSLKDMEAGKGQEILVKLATAWAARDATALQSYDQWCDCMESEAERAMSRRLLDDRNQVLAGRINALHSASGPVFVAVGALHMFGPSGLPALMKALGYTVETVF
ncbi:TraB/GumN family protein [Ottowia sp.]|uniref:TraB/GumN family protein n=1 Tax=Ottowia sp. TaxID=1898956 RepID=UPI003C715450